MDLLNVFWYVYFTIACFIFFEFCIGNIGFHLTNRKNNKEANIPYWLYAILVALFSLAWPMVCIYLIRDRED